MLGGMCFGCLSTWTPQGESPLALLSRTGEHAIAAVDQTPGSPALSVALLGIGLGIAAVSVATAFLSRSLWPRHGDRVNQAAMIGAIVAAVPMVGAVLTSPLLGGASPFFAAMMTAFLAAVLGFLLALAIERLVKRTDDRKVRGARPWIVLAVAGSAMIVSLVGTFGLLSGASEAFKTIVETPTGPWI